jgi:hypothetical protein
MVLRPTSVGQVVVTVSRSGWDAGPSGFIDNVVELVACSEEGIRIEIRQSAVAEATAI